MDDRREGRDPGRGRRAGSPQSRSGVFGFHQTTAGVRGFGWSVRKPRSGREPTFKFGYQNVTDPAVHLSESLSPDLKTSQIRPETHSGGLRRSKSQMIIDPNLNDYPDPAGVGYGNKDPAGLVSLAGHWIFGTGLRSGRPATRGRTAT
jgi:hypothetical protein